MWCATRLCARLACGLRYRSACLVIILDSASPSAYGPSLKDRFAIMRLNGSIPTAERRQREKETANVPRRSPLTKGKFGTNHSTEKHRQGQGQQNILGLNFPTFFNQDPTKFHLSKFWAVPLVHHCESITISSRLDSIPGSDPFS